MPKILNEDQVVEVLRKALRSVGNSPLLDDGVPRDQLLAMNLDAVFASDENLASLVKAIKSGIASQGGRVLLGTDEIKDAQTLQALLETVRAQQVDQ